MSGLATESTRKGRTTARGCLCHFDRVDVLLIALLVVGLVPLLATLAYRNQRNKTDNVSYPEEIGSSRKGCPTKA